jgi:hypothetical protein
VYLYVSVPLEMLKTSLLAHSSRSTHPALSGSGRVVFLYPLAEMGAIGIATQPTTAGGAALGTSGFFFIFHHVRG